MLHTRTRPRGGIILLMIVLALSVSACYKNAGEDVEPTSNRVELEDLSPTTTPTPTVPADLSPTASREPLQATPTGSGPDAAATTTDDASEILPTSADGAAEQVNPLAVPTASRASITTPSMSDIVPTRPPTATIDPTLLPTPTPLPPEANPCIYVVKGGDTLYTIASNNEVDLAALIAANPTLLTAGEFTTLQIGWQLNLPGCGTPTPTAGAPAADSVPAADRVPAASGEQTTHIVQSGETIYAIARQYGVDPQAIATANNLADPSRIYPGQELIIPAP